MENGSTCARMRVRLIVLFWALICIQISIHGVQTRLDLYPYTYFGYAFLAGKVIGCITSLVLLLHLNYTGDSIGLSDAVSLCIYLFIYVDFAQAPQRHYARVETFSKNPKKK